MKTYKICKHEASIEAVAITPCSANGGILFSKHLRKRGCKIQFCIDANKSKEKQREGWKRKPLFCPTR